MKKNLALFVAFFFICLGVKAQTKTVIVEPAEATIYVNNDAVGTGTYPIKFSRRMDAVRLTFTAPGYIPMAVTLRKDYPSKSVIYKMKVDEAFNNSSEAGGNFSANKNISIICKKGMSEDEAWKRLIAIVSDEFPTITVRDKASSWLETDWEIQTFTYQYVRTRLVVKPDFADEGEVAYKVMLCSEIADRGCGRSDNCFEKYDRVLKKYENIISELQSRLGNVR